MRAPGKRPGPAQDRWYPADAGRLLGVVLVPVAWLTAGWPAAAAMFLVVGGQWLLRWYLLGRSADAAGQLVLLAAGWFSAVGLYHQVSWLDAVMHTLASLVVALLVAELLAAQLLQAESAAASAERVPSAGAGAGSRAGARAAQPLPEFVGPHARSVVGQVAVLVCVTVTLGVVWELGEWLGHTFITPEIGVGYDDTVGDLTANLVGAVLGAVVSVRPRRRTPGGEHRPSRHTRRRETAAAGPGTGSRSGR